MLHVPDDSTQWPPLPEQEDEREAAGQYIRASLRRRRDEPRQKALEPLTRHHAMLHGEKRQQRHVYGQRGLPGVGRRRIERFWNDEIPNETNRIKKREKEDHVAQGAVSQGQCFAHIVSYRS